MDKINEIKKIVVKCLKNLGQDEMITEFIHPVDKTLIQEVLDSMGLVVLSVDIEEKYYEMFGKEIKILNVENTDFLKNFKDVETLVEYINKL